MTKEELKSECNSLVDMIKMSGDLGSQVYYYDKKSDKNLKEKYKILMKLFMGKELTDEENENRNVFEKLPKNGEEVIYN